MDRLPKVLLATAGLLALVAVWCVATFGAPSQKCLGAAARDRAHPCVNLTRSVYPSPDDVDADFVAGSPCDPVDEPLGPCTFGVRAAKARRHFALVGDSHALQWRRAVDVVAVANRWRGFSITTGGCFFSDAVKQLAEGLREPCEGWYRLVLKWFRHHPEVSTVFVSEFAPMPVRVAPGGTYFGVKAAGFRRAWRALPKTVRHVIVIRDTPMITQATFDCVRRVIAAGTERPGPACSTPAKSALRWDTAVSTVRMIHSKRYGYVDLTEFFCSPRTCDPVIGGVLVNRDPFGHITTAYSRTLGPYLLRKVRRLMATW